MVPVAEQIFCKGPLRLKISRDEAQSSMIMIRLFSPCVLFKVFNFYLNLNKYFTPTPKGGLVRTTYSQNK